MKFWTGLEFTRLEDYVDKSFNIPQISVKHMVIDVEMWLVTIYSGIHPLVQIYAGREGVWIKEFADSMRGRLGKDRIRALQWHIERCLYE